MKRALLFRLALLLTIVLAASITLRTQAASNLQVSQYGTAGYTVTGVADTDDAGGLDYVCVICRNADNSLNDVDIWGFEVESTIDYDQGCNNQVPPNIATAPYSVTVIDVPGPFAGTLDTPEGAAYCESFASSGPPTDSPSSPTSSSAPAPTCIDTIAIPDWAVGGTFLSDANIYWEPSADKGTEHVITAGNTARVLGVDESGNYAKIIWVCDMLWVEASTLGPNSNSPWNGAPLPTVVVE